MPLWFWLSIPAVFALWVSCWIASMDPTGNSGDSMLLVVAAFAFTALLVRSAALRLARPS
jgi:hypothetical protein